MSDPSNITLDYHDPFPPALFANAEIDNIALDSRGDVYIAGIEGTGRMFVARHNRSGVVGTTYVTPYSGDVSTSPVFGHLVVNAGGLAYVSGTALNTATGDRDIVIWRVDPTGDVRWSTVVECAGDLQTADALIVREADQSILVAASMESPGGWCEQPAPISSSGPCTHVLQLAAATGGVLRTRVAEPDQLQIVRRPRLITHAGTFERVYTVSVMTRHDFVPVDKVFVEGFDFPLDSVVEVDVSEGERDAGLRARARATPFGFRLTIDGLGDAGAEIRVFDVAGRSVSRGTLTPGASVLEIEGAANGVYFVDVHATDGRVVKLKTVVID